MKNLKIFKKVNGSCLYNGREYKVYKLFKLTFGVCGLRVIKLIF